MTARDTHASRRPFNASIDWTYVFHDSAGGLMVVMSAELLKAACTAGGWRLTQGAEPMTGIDRLPAHQNRGFAVGDAREVLGTLPAATLHCLSRYRRSRRQLGPRPLRRLGYKTGSS